MSQKPLVHVVDDDESFRVSLLRLLTVRGFDALGYPTTGDFLLNPPCNRHGCVLLDIQLPGPSGLDLQAVLQRQGIWLPVIFLTGHADVPSSVQAMKAGAVDFLAKPVDPDVLFEAIYRALEIERAQSLARDEESQLKVRFASLSPRERQVFERVVAGKLNKQIADELGIAERTVKAQRSQLMQKLEAGSAAELGKLAERMAHLTDDPHFPRAGP